MYAFLAGHVTHVPSSALNVPLRHIQFPVIGSNIVLMSQLMHSLFILTVLFMHLHVRSYVLNTEFMPHFMQSFRTG